MPSVSSKSPRRTAKQNVEHVHKHMVQLNIFVCLRIHQATAEIRLPRHALLTLLLGLWGQEGDPLRGEGEDCLDLLQESHHRADAVRATVDSLTKIKITKIISLFKTPKAIHSVWGVTTLHPLFHESFQLPTQLLNGWIKTRIWPVVSSLACAPLSCPWALLPSSNWGSESDENQSYHNGNSDPRGFGEYASLVCLCVCF